MTGYIAASCDTDHGKLYVFQELLPKIICWIDKSCGSMDDEPHISVFGEPADFIR